MTSFVDISAEEASSFIVKYPVISNKDFVTTNNKVQHEGKSDYSGIIRAAVKNTCLKISKLENI